MDFMESLSHLLRIVGDKTLIAVNKKVLKK